MINFIPIVYAQISVPTSSASSIGQTASAQMSEPGTLFWLALVLGVPLAFWIMEMLLDTLANSMEARAEAKALKEVREKPHTGSLSYRK